MLYNRRRAGVATATVMMPMMMSIVMFVVLMVTVVLAILFRGAAVCFWAGIRNRNRCVVFRAIIVRFHNWRWLGVTRIAVATVVIIIVIVMV